MRLIFPRQTFSIVAGKEGRLAVAALLVVDAINFSHCNAAGDTAVSARSHPYEVICSRVTLNCLRDKPLLKLTYEVL